jgi:2-C-methyl-D-erythritol 2,4-cyclodiphosphate synthase
MQQTEIRSGLGYDIHAFSTDVNRPLYLGGVHFPGEIGLEGHSDADVLIHAVADAILGASGGGDIGILFPNTDPTHKNQPSTDFLKIIRELLDQNGWKIVNIDSSVICEHPKIANRYDEMKKNIGLALGIEPDRINIKATTNEKLGAIGRGEGIAAFATANLSRAR